MTGHVKIGGAWKDLAGVSVRVGGVWKEVTNGYTRIAGVWKEWFAGVSFWLKMLTSDYTQPTGVTADSSGNVYSSVSDNGALNLFKWSADGALQWQYTWATGQDPQAITVDSSENVIVAGNNTGAVGGSNSGFVLKANSSGTLQWYRAVRYSANDSVQKILADSSGNVYFAGKARDSSNDFRTIIGKLNSAGTEQWKRQHSTIGQDASGLNTDGTFIYLGIANNITKINSSGTLQWGRFLSQFGVTNSTTDSSGNTYIAGAFSDRGKLTKINSSGTHVWSRQISRSTTTIQCSDVAVDSADNVYVLGQWFGSTRRLFVIKYNSSGTLQWQRWLYRSGSSTDVSNSLFQHAIHIDSSDTLYVMGQIDVSGQRRPLWAKLPSDGSLTGSYTVDGTIVYSSSDLTSSTITVTVNVDGSSLPSSSFTISSATPTRANIAQTETTTTIG